MALTATFAADFSAFEKSVQSAQAHLRVFDRGVKTSSRDITRELERISGQKVAVEAAKMAEAVKRLGGEGGTAAGLLKLTDDELSRFTTTMLAATDKAERLGEELPASLSDVNAELAKLPKSTAATATGFASVTSAMGQMAGAFTAGALLTRAVDGIVDLGREAFQSAGDLVDLRAATGSSLEMLQRWTHVAEQGGIELEDMTTAAFKLGTKLDGGSDSVRGAVESLGMSFIALRGSRAPLDELLKASDALGPSQQRNTAFVELFGAKGAQSLARISDGYRETAKAAEVASDASIEAMERAGAEYDRLMRKMKTLTKEVIGGLIVNTASAAAGFQEFTADQKKALATVAAAGDALGPSALTDMMDKFRAENAKLAEAEKNLAAQRDRSMASLEPYAEQLVTARAQIEKLSEADRAALDAAQALGRGFEAVAERLGLNEDAQRIYGSVVKETAKDSKLGAEAARAYAEALGQLTGAGALASGLKAESLLQGAGGAQGVMMSELEGLRAMFVKAAEGARQMGDVKLAEFYEATAEELKPLTQLQARYNVKIGEFVQMGMAAADASAHVSQSLDEVKGNITRILPELNAAAHAWSAYRDAVEENEPTQGFDFGQVASAMKEALRDIPNIVIDTIVNGGDWRRAATAIASRLGTELGGAVGKYFGGPMGEAVGRAVGSLAGPALDKIIGVFTGPSAQADITRRVKASWGVAISEGLADAIAAVAKSSFGGNRQAAEIFSLDKIIGEAGGLNAGNLDRMIGKLRDVFVMVQAGAFTSAQAVAVLDKNWQSFVDAGTDASGRLAPALTEIIRLTKQLGIESKAIRDYQIGQSGAALDGLNAVINASKKQFDSYEKIAGAVRDAQKEVDALNKVEERGRGVEWHREMQAAQDALTKALTAQHGAAEGAAAELENLGRIAMGTYAAAIEAGMSHNEALRAAAPGLSQLSKAYADLGLNVEDAGLKAFLAQAKFVESNPEILAGIDGLSQSMIALSNIGLLNADTFAQMQQAGLRMYERLLAEAGKMGLEGDEAARAALLPMQEYLRNAEEQAKLLGVPLDENTQKLIDQAKALGLWKDKGKEPMEEMRDAVLEMRDAVKELVNALKGIPPRVTSDITTRYHTEGQPPAGGGSGGGTGPAPSPQPTVGPSGAAAAGATASTADRGSISVPVFIDGRQVAEASVPYIPNALRRRGVAVATWP